MINRILALILMGVVSIFTIALPIGVLTGGDALSHRLGIATVFILTALIVFTGRASSVWSRLCFINGLVALALPLMAIAFSAMFAAEGGSNIDAHAGAVLGGVMLTGAAAFIGFFVAARASLASITGAAAAISFGGRPGSASVAQRRVGEQRVAQSMDPDQRRQFGRRHDDR